MDHPDTATPTTKPSTKLRWRAWHSELAALVASGATLTDAATRLGRSRQACSLATRRRGFDELIEREATRQRAEAERLLSLARPAAVRALQRIVERAAEDPAAIEPSEARAAAATILAASSPPSERQRQTARIELLRALSPALRREVVAALDNAASSYLAGLTDEELDRLLEESR